MFEDCVVPGDWPSESPRNRRVIRMHDFQHENLDSSGQTQVVSHPLSGPGLQEYPGSVAIWRCNSSPWAGFFSSVRALHGEKSASLTVPASISWTLDMLSHSISLLSIDFLHADFRHPTAITYMVVFLGQCAIKNEALSLSQWGVTSLDPFQAVEVTSAVLSIRRRLRLHTLRPTV